MWVPSHIFAQPPVGVKVIRTNIIYCHDFSVSQQNMYMYRAEYDHVASN
jgi:hypothetical protein